MGPLVPFTVTETLFHGGRVILHRAIRNADSRPVVLKTLDPQCSRPRDLARLKHEHEIGQILATDAVVSPLALDTFEGIPALVLEDFGGRPLDQLLGAPMPLDRFLPLAVRIAGAVAEIHRRGVVHKDLKPHNILVRLDTGEVKITDLGMASRLPREHAAPPNQGRIEGSLPYMSPEQTGRMNRAVDSRSDLYALGVTFYQMLTGRLPFEARDPLEWVHCHVACTPRTPSQIHADVPEVLSAIVSKLLAKMAEDRYQTARGLEHDLARCLSDWQQGRALKAFSLGEHDASDRLEIERKLHGRDAEVAELFAAFARVADRGAPELVLVSGYSGIGKSSLIRELYRPVVQAHGFFVAGKFDQYKRNIPYSIFAQAFAQIVEHILTESEERMALWRTELARALGANGQLIVDVIPQVELILGPQPPIPDLPPLESQNRFHLVFRQFVGVFARQEHPLALFLDDLHWIDSGSLELTKDLLASHETRYLLILGAYRDNEVGPSHPLAIALDELRKAGGAVREIVLSPLAAPHLGQILAGALRCTPERAAPLSRLVHEKTGGNPFFAIQFLTSLHEEGLLSLDRAAREWRWDVERIEAKGFTENVLDLMVRKMRRLPPATQEMLELAACAGNTASLRTLAVISGKSEEEAERDLWDAVREGLMLCDDDRYTFLHDRVQQGAYALIGDDRKKTVHLQIGRLLLASLPAASVEEKVFDVVSQLDHGVDLVSDPAEKDQLLRLNTLAGRKAKASIAYASARSFFDVAASLLPEDAWESRYEAAFSLFMERAECEYLCGAFDKADALFHLLLCRARSDFDKAAVYQLRLRLYHVAGKYDEGLAMALEALHLFGVTIPDDRVALAEATGAEAEAVRVNLRGRRIADVADGLEATDPAVRAVIGLLSNAAPAAYIGTRPEVFPLIILKLVNTSLRHGHTCESCMGYSAYGFMLVSLFDDPRGAQEFSEMSIRLNQKLGDVSRRGMVMHLHGDHINFWSRPIPTDFPILESGFRACLDAGDLVFGSYIAFEIVWQAVERGDTLDDVLALSRRYAAFARDSRNEAVLETIRVQQQFLACLEGHTRETGTFDDAAFEEGPCLEKITGAAFMCGVVFYHMTKLIAAYLFGDDAAAARHAGEAKRTLSAAMAMPMEATFHYFDALLLARGFRGAAEEARPAMLEMLLEHNRKLACWAQNCPENFLTKHALVSAEIARITGDDLGAEQRYEEAIRSARENGFVHWEAIALERAGAFHGERGLEIAALAYLREARHAYARWGADAKVRALEQACPALRDAAPPGVASTFAARTDQLDLLSVTKASQTISSEIVLDKLARTLLEVALEQGSGERACLVLCREGRLSIEAEATIDARGTLTSTLGSEPLDASRRLPVSLIHYARRMKERVILIDATTDPGKFSGDDYLSRERPRSVLCVPILRQAEVVGLLYLENRLLAGAFTAERLAALELLATQVVISLQNATLLAEERGARTKAELAEQRAAFLAEAGALLSESLDYEDTLARLGRLAVKSLGTWCVIDLVEGRDIRRVATAHSDPAKEPALTELQRRHPPRWDSPHPASEALRTGQPFLMQDLTDEWLRSRSEDDDHYRLLREIGAVSGVAAPLVSRGQTLGVLSIVSAVPGHRYERADVDLMMEVARRAASAIDNARLYRASQEAVRARNEFLTVASHELNTPVTSLVLALQSLLRAAPSGKPLDAATMERLLRLAMRQGTRLTKLVSDLLDISRIEGGRLPLDPARFDLRALAREVIERFEPDIARSRCAVSLRDGAAVVGRWDRSHLDRVLTNLLSNAVKFGAGKPVEIAVGEERGLAWLTVRDNGIGIEPSSCARIFGRFERAVSERHYGGLGLGLYISRRIVEEHGGTIRCESRPGRGSTFTIQLPLS